MVDGASQGQPFINVPLLVCSFSSSIKSLVNGSTVILLHIVRLVLVSDHFKGSNISCIFVRFLIVYDHFKGSNIWCIFVRYLTVYDHFKGSNISCIFVRFVIVYDHFKGSNIWCICFIFL